MQNRRYSEDRYAEFDPQKTPGNSMMPHAGGGGNQSNAQMNGYGGSQMGGQNYQQQMGSSNGPQMPVNNYPNQQQFAYGPSHMATYANANANHGFDTGYGGNAYGGNRRQSVTSGMQLNVPNIGLPPLAIKVFAQRDKDGRAIPPMFVTAANPDAGVINIKGNPFSIKTNEILVALGQDAVVQDYPQSSGIHAIHIIQDRNSGKTDDIYVELCDWSEAEKVLRRYDNQSSRDRAPKLGNRRVRLTLTTASALMKAIFPRAKCLWANGKPERPDEWLKDNPCNWDGFVTREEMVKVLMFTEQTYSSKTRFAQECPERVYQTMISTMQKIPWEADRFFFPKDWVMEFHNALKRMAVCLARHVVERSHINLDTKLLEQFMKAMHSSPMYGNGDPKALENYMTIATKVDEIVSAAPGVAAPPLRRGTLVGNNDGGHRSESRARDESLKEGLRSMQIADQQTRDRSPVRSWRNQSPTRRDYSPERRGQSPVRREFSPVRREPSPARREQAPVFRERSPVRRGRNESPVHRQESPVRRDWSDYSPSAVRRDDSPVRHQRQESPVRLYTTPARRKHSPARRGYWSAPNAPRAWSPVRRELSPIFSEGSHGGVPVRDSSLARRSEQYASEHSSRASNRATNSGSPMYSSSSGRRSALQFSESSTCRSGRRSDD
ncbi:hypothetical protein E2P81_ATG08909 [Venturia nashicola]|nr:hypothetical protein E2P81_ATG08909 [Venturia nashicola]